MTDAPYPDTISVSYKMLNAVLPLVFIVAAVLSIALPANVQLKSATTPHKYPHLPIPSRNPNRPSTHPCKTFNTQSSAILILSSALDQLMHHTRLDLRQMPHDAQLLQPRILRAHLPEHA